MPFTLSHAAAALAFRRTPLIPSALVIGTMAPDLPYFLPGPTGRELTHTPLGVVTIDLLIGLVVFVGWALVVRRPAVDLAPAFIRERMPRLPRPRILLLVASLIAGTLTHLAWDFFTHPGPLEELVPALAVAVGPLTPTKWLQHGSSLLGLVLLAVWINRWAHMNDRASASSDSSQLARIASWLAIAATFTAVGLVVWGNGIAEGYAPLDPYLVFTIARRSIGATLVISAAIVLAWQAQRLYRERRTATTLPSTSA